MRDFRKCCQVRLQAVSIRDALALIRKKLKPIQASGQTSLFVSNDGVFITFLTQISAECTLTRGFVKMHKDDCKANSSFAGETVTVSVLRLPRDRLTFRHMALSVRFSYTLQVHGEGIHRTD